MLTIVSKAIATVTGPKVSTAGAELAVDLRVAIMHLNRRLRSERSSDQITDGQYAVLAALNRCGPMTPRELADHERVQPPSMTRTIGHLVDAGLVDRADHPEDGRQIVVSLTDQGEHEVRETRRRRDAWLARHLRNLTAADRQTLAAATEILRRLTTQ